MLDDAPGWLRALGVRGWLLAGVAILVGGGLWLFGLTAGISVPLVVAIVLGMLLYPLVDWLGTHGVPRAIGAAIVVLLVVAVAAAATYVVVQGVVVQADEIAKQVTAGVDALSTWADDMPFAEETIDRIFEGAQSVAPSVAGGLFSFLTSGLSGVISFFIGSLLSLFMFYYVLKDWRSITSWAGGKTGLGARLGAELVEDGTRATQQYFKALTVSSLIVSTIIGLTMYLLGLPLAAAIAVVTMLTSYVPFLGAFVSGAFAFLIAFGSGGPTQALIVLVVILITQNVVQTPILNKMASDELNIHPLVTLLSTLFGGVVAGILGAALGTPLAAFGLKASARLREERPPDSQPAP